MSRYQDPCRFSNMCLVFKFFEKLLFVKVSTMQKFFNDDYVSSATIARQLKAISLKTSSHSDQICRKNGAKTKVPKNIQKCTKNSYANTFVPSNLSIHSQIMFSFNREKINLSYFCGLNFSFLRYKFIKLCPKSFWQGPKKRSVLWLSPYINSYDQKSIHITFFKPEL